MKLIVKVMGAVLMLLVPVGVMCSDSNDLSVRKDNALIERGRVIVKEFQARLGSTLKKALQEGGPEKAVEVCSVSAQKISKNTESLLSIKLKRVTDKPRNPLDMADEFDLPVLKDFSAALKLSQNASLEKLTTTADGKKRFYKGIVIKAVCLNCHGSSLSPDLKMLINKKYPDDKAIGYQLGDLRGAFVVEF